MNIVNEILSKSNPIEELTSIDSESFKKNYFDKKNPVLIKGFAKKWGATKKWDLDFFSNLKFEHDIHLISGDFIQGDNRYNTGVFKSFIKNLKEAEAKNETTKQYLTTLNIFDYLPSLNDDIDFSLFEKFTKINDISAWIGPPGTISGFHRDSGKNMYAQIKGKKMFIICSTKFNKSMYPSSKYMNGAVPSQVDINNFDAEKFPKFKNVEFKSIILEPGDVLYVPQNWWHYVQSLDTSISVSNFGYTKNELYSIKFPEKVLDFLHRRGLYKSKNCFCCNS